MNTKRIIKEALREIFDRKSSFKRNVYGVEGDNGRHEEYREVSKNKTIIWNPEYNVGFQYVFDDLESDGYTFIHLYPYSEDGHNHQWDKLSNSEQSKLFMDAIKKLPKVLKNFFKKFGVVNNIVFRPKTSQMGSIYSSPLMIRYLESNFGSNYNIEVNKENSESLPINTVIMRLKNEDNDPEK